MFAHLIPYVAPIASLGVGVLTGKWLGRDRTPPHDVVTDPHVPLPFGCGSHLAFHWCEGERGHEGEHQCPFCDAHWPPA